MKNVFRIMTVAAVLAAGAAYAQDRATISANVPFSFRMGATVLPAGDYKVIQNPRTGYLALVHTETLRRGAALTFIGRPMNGTDVTRLVFHKYGNHYFLAQVYAPNDGFVRALSPSAVEREFVKAPAPAQIAYVPLKVSQ